MNPPPQLSFKAASTGHDYLSPFQFLCSRPVLPLRSQTFYYFPEPETETRENPSDFCFLFSNSLFQDFWPQLTAERKHELSQRRTRPGEIGKDSCKCHLLHDIFHFLSTNRVGAIQNPQWEMNLHINYPILGWYDLFSLMINSWNCKFSHPSPQYTHIQRF